MKCKKLGIRSHTIFYQSPYYTLYMYYTTYVHTMVCKYYYYYQFYQKEGIHKRQSLYKVLAQYIQYKQDKISYSSYCILHYHTYVHT